jgi:hypothetical protein
MYIMLPPIISQMNEMIRAAVYWMECDLAENIPLESICHVEVAVGLFGGNLAGRITKSIGTDHGIHSSI